MIDLNYSYLNNLNNANHVGVTVQINNEAQAFISDNPTLTAAKTALAAAINREDIAYLKTQKDWNVERLKTEDHTLDCLMICVRSILSGHASLPDGYPLKQKAKEFLQLWKDFGFQTSDSYSGESSKVINMWQEVSARQADAEALGIYGYFQDANAQALLVQQLLSQRFDELSSRIVGELRDARLATDSAIKQFYLVLNSMQVLSPSAELTALVRKFKAIEDYARQYYLKTNASSSNSGGGSGSGGGTTPDNPDTPGGGGSDTPGGGGDTPGGGGDTPGGGGDTPGGGGDTPGGGGDPDDPEPGDDMD